MRFATEHSLPLVTRNERERRNGHNGLVIWFTGLSGSGKSTLASHVERSLHERGLHTFLLDGDVVRHGLSYDLNFSEAGRRENLRRVGEACRFFVDAGVVVLAAFISPLRADRAMVRSLTGRDDFVEVYCDAPLSVCEQRDVKGLYAKARRGEIADFTGISSSYQPPENAEIVVRTGTSNLNDCTKQVVRYVVSHCLKNQSK